MSKKNLTLSKPKALTIPIVPENQEKKIFYIQQHLVFRSEKPNKKQTTKSVSG
jgi:hypothetical protein